jgi:formylglycine-generating enzyme required for sulfatase activity
VENVSWTNAKEFCRKLTEAEKGKLASGMHYDLPSEAQWTFFAADAKSDDGVVKRAETEGTMPVGSKAANKYGLYDIIGNVWEWCNGTDPQKKPSRGYAFNSTGGLTRFAPSFTSTFDADLSRSDIGFRIVIVQ